MQVIGKLSLEIWKSKCKATGAIADLIMMIANGIVDWSIISVLMVSRSMALDKNPGVKPIGIGEALRRLMGKVMNVQDIRGMDQLCYGLKGGIKGAVHAIREVLDANSEDGYGMSMVDARNAFNSVNRVVGLWNAHIYWPRCSRYLFNTYQRFPMLWIKHITRKVSHKEIHCQCAFMLFALIFGQGSRILYEMGPLFGYYPEPKKSEDTAELF